MGHFGSVPPELLAEERAFSHIAVHEQRGEYDSEEMPCVRGRASCRAERHEILLRLMQEQVALSGEREDSPDEEQGDEDS